MSTERQSERQTEAIRSVGHAITAPVAGASDATGGHVESLTEAVMGMTTALENISSSLDSIAQAIRDSYEHD